MPTKKKNQHDFDALFNKKGISNQDRLTQLPVAKFGSFIFIFFFIGSFFSSFPTQDISPVAKPAFTVVSQNKEAYMTGQAFNPDLVIPSILNYKTTQKVPQKSYKDYLKKTDIIDFQSFSSEKISYQLEGIDLMNGINHIKHMMMEEDLSIVPFNSGQVTIESEIIETTQSQHYYMVEVSKTFTQDKKVIKVLEKKVFNLDSLESGNFNYYKNIIFNSSSYSND